MTDYPRALVEVDHIEPVPRRVRATLGDQTVLDTTSALYVWEWPYYPQYYIPLADVRPDVLVDENHVQELKRGKARRHGVRVGGVSRPGAARVFGDDAMEGMANTVRFDWDAMDAWYEEDEQVFVHPRNPYSRVDALRSTRHVRIELDGVVLAESSSPVLVFETGLPTRYYLNRTEVDFGHLVPSDTVTACPYKGVTSGYWSVRIGDTVHKDLAWALRLPDPAAAADHRAGRVLQREGRRVHRRRATGTARHSLLQVVEFSSRTRKLHRRTQVGPCRIVLLIARFRRPTEHGAMDLRLSFRLWPSPRPRCWNGTGAARGRRRAERDHRPRPSP